MEDRHLGVNLANLNLKGNETANRVAQYHSFSIFLCSVGIETTPYIFVALIDSLVHSLTLSVIV